VTLRKKLAFLAVIWGFVVLVFVGWEIALRLSKGATTTRLRYAWSEAVLGEFLPNQRLQDTRKPRVKWTVTINEDGYRGRRVALPKPPRVYRILLLGDSLVESQYVDDGLTFGEQLEADVRRRAGDRVEVVAIGRAGYTITDEAAYFREKGHRFEPDLMILVSPLNDVSDLSRRVQYRELLKQLSGYERRHSYLQMVIAPIRGTAVYNYLYRKWVYLAYRTSMPVGAIDPRPQHEEVSFKEARNREWSPAYTAYAERYCRLLGAFHTEIARDGRRVLYAVFPDVEQMDPADPQTMQRHLKACADRHGITHLDLLPALRAASRNRALFLLPYDRHPNGHGYAAAVQAIGAELSRLGWLPARS
jgi:lysophospholipase L1-like esterase